MVGLFFKKGFSWGTNINAQIYGGIVLHGGNIANAFSSNLDIVNLNISLNHGGIFT